MNVCTTGLLAAVGDFIAKAPAVWAAFVTVGGVVTGVVLTNRENRLRQAQEFVHKRAEKQAELDFQSTEQQRERQANLRRDVYLPAAEAVVGMIGAISNLLRLDASEDDANERARIFGAALTRIQMVASSETIRSVAELQRAFLTMLSEMHKLRFPMMLRKTHIELALAAQGEYHAERVTCVALLKECNLAATRDERRFQTIQQRDAYAAEQWGEAHRDWQRLTLAQETERLAMAREFAVRLAALSKLQAHAFATIRRELEQGDDAALILEEIEKTTVVGVQFISDMIPLSERALEEIRRDVEADDRRRANAAA